MKTQNYCMNKITQMAIRWQNTTDKLEKAHLFSNIHYASSYLYREKYKHISYISTSNYEDFRSECLLELHRSLSAYDKDKGYQYHTYLKSCLRRAVRLYMASLPIMRLSTKRTWGEVVSAIKLESTLSPVSDDGKYAEKICGTTKQPDVYLKTVDEILDGISYFTFHKNQEKYLKKLRKYYRKDIELVTGKKVLDFCL